MKQTTINSLAAALCLAGFGVGTAMAAAEKPNIILCMTDDQGWGDTSYNGHKKFLTEGGKARIVDNEYRFQNGRLFRFDEAQKKDIDITDEKPDDYKRLAEVNKQFLESVKKDQRAYTFKKPAKGAESK